MVFLAFLIPLLGYALVYSGMMTLRTGPGGLKTGTLESMIPGFDPASKLLGGPASGEATPETLETLRRCGISLAEVLAAQRKFGFERDPSGRSKYQNWLRDRLARCKAEGKI